MNSYQINSFAVIGAGNMGSGIAQKIATEGYPVILVDLTEAQVERGMGIIREMLDQGVKRKIFRPEQAEAILGRIQATTRWEDLAEVDCVIEAVFESLDVKKDVFQRLAKVTKPTCILGTNTSSFFVKDVAEVTPNPERVLGLHYFFHPAKNRLVEIIGHEKADPAAFDAAWAAQEAIGKTPIRSADAPGFVVNRYFVPWLNEAVRLLEEGVADIATIEWAAKKAFNIGMGPFELMNITGVPIAMHAANTLGAELDDFYAPSAALVNQVETIKENWTLSGEPQEEKYTAVAERLLGVAFYVASKLVDEGVATIEDTDIGARVGLRWSEGPFQLLNKVGVDEARRMVHETMAPYGLETPALLADASADGIAIRLVSAERRGSLAGVWINRPDAMNALNPEVGHQLAACFEEAANSGASGVVIGGSGKAFIAGADIKFFVDHIRGNTFQEIYTFTEDSQKLLRSFRNSKSPVIARAQGLALGGGAELAMGCDWIVASPKSVFGFPETGIGIYPGLGGTQRLPRRVGLPLAKYLVYTGQIIPASQALAIGLIDEVAAFADLDSACESWATKGKAYREMPTTCRAKEWQPIWDFFATYSVDEILSGTTDAGGDPRLEKAVKLMGYKSSHALHLAERLFNEGTELPLDEALALELRDLEEVFSHADALEGLSSLIEGRRPSFQSAVTA
jgi:enoyl-CoA hydratase/3-hydroxyacyl-CoA dehydrogenase